MYLSFKFWRKNPISLIGQVQRGHQPETWLSEDNMCGQLMTNATHYTEITNTNVTTWAWQELNWGNLSYTNWSDATSMQLSCLLASHEMLISIMFALRQMDDAHDKLCLLRPNWVGKREIMIWKYVSRVWVGVGAGWHPCILPRVMVVTNGSGWMWWWTQATRIPACAIVGHCACMVHPKIQSTLLLPVTVCRHNIHTHINTYRQTESFQVT